MALGLPTPQPPSKLVLPLVALTVALSSFLIAGTFSPGLPEERKRKAVTIRMTDAGWVGLIGIVIPKKDRTHILGDLIEECRDLEKQGVSTFKRRLYVAGEILFSLVPQWRDMIWHAICGAIGFLWARIIG